MEKLRAAGIIQREIAVLDPIILGPVLIVVIEISLDRQTAEDLDTFEAYVCAEPAVTQCYRLSPGPAFLIVAEVLDMANYDELARQLFKASSNVRNVRTFFSTFRAKFEPNALIT